MEGDAPPGTMSTLHWGTVAANNTQPRSLGLGHLKSDTLTFMETLPSCAAEQRYVQQLGIQ